MRNNRILILLFITSLLLGCFLQREHFDVVRKTPKLKYETPPGCVWLRDNVFMDMTEINNLEYLEFLYWTSRQEPQRLVSLLPDTAVWGNSENGKLLCKYYLRHPAFRDYPVVGISYEQAVAFCKWRSDRVNQFICIRDQYAHVKNLKWDTVSHFAQIVRYTLPTKEQWEYASAASLDFNEFPLGYEKLTDKKNIPVSNTLEYSNLYGPDSIAFRIRISLDSIKYAKAKIPTTLEGMGPKNKYGFGAPNKFGIYNLLGNVSEIIADNLFKGLNYETSLDGSTFKLKKENYQIVDSTSNGYDYKYTFRYTKPQAWLGFRCVCEVLKEK